MTILLTKTRRPASSARLKVACCHNLFSILNRRSFVTYGLMTVLVLLLGTYMAAVFSAANEDMRTRTSLSRIESLTKRNEELRVSVQQKTARFEEDNQELLGSMEKISNVTYLTQENVAISRAPTNP